MVTSIFITGGASGIGRAVAALFAARGWRVGLADIDTDGLARVSEEIGGATTYCLDVRDAASWTEALADFAAADTGALGVLFNNAGIAVSGPFAATPMAEIERIVAINLIGVVNGAHAGFPFLKAGQGMLLNTASAAAIWGTANAAIYSATKFGVRGLSEALDGEWAGDGVRVAVLMPSFIDTPLLDAVPTGSNETSRDRVRAAGLEFTPVETVARAAWDAVHGTRIHWQVGKTARRLAFAARWMPGRLRRTMGRRLK